MITDFVAFVTALTPEQINFIASLTEEELHYLKKIAKQTYNELNPDDSINKVRALSFVENKQTTNATTAEERNAAGLVKLFGEFDKFAGLSDSAFAEVVNDELWSHQSVFSRESAMLESIIDRLKRSANGALPLVKFVLDD